MIILACGQENFGLCAENFGLWDILLAHSTQNCWHTWQEFAKLNCASAWYCVWAVSNVYAWCGKPTEDFGAEDGAHRATGLKNKAHQYGKSFLILLYS